MTRSLLPLLFCLVFGCAKVELEKDDEVNPIQKTTLLVGTSKVNITPNENSGVKLAGFSSRRGESLKGIHDDIFA